MQIETMDEMLARLNGTGAAGQIKAVIKSIKLINQASGLLDAENRATALYHLSAALSGNDRAFSTLIDTAYWLQNAKNEAQEKNEPACVHENPLHQDALDSDVDWIEKEISQSFQPPKEAEHTLSLVPAQLVAMSGETA